MGGVQEPRFDKALLVGREARNFNIAHAGRSGYRSYTKNTKKMYANREGNPLKRKLLVTSGILQKPSPFSWRSLYQKLGFSQKKYHFGTESRDGGRADTKNQAVSIRTTLWRVAAI
jgi:hypothetical protein